MPQQIKPTNTSTDSAKVFKRIRFVECRVTGGLWVVHRHTKAYVIAYDDPIYVWFSHISSVIFTHDMSLGLFRKGA
jgi:hypothetical protein